MEGQIQKALGFHQKYLSLCSENEQRYYGSGTTWGWVINDRIFIFGWTILFKFVYTCGSADRTPCEFEWNWLHTSTKTRQNHLIKNRAKKEEKIVLRKVDAAFEHRYSDMYCIHQICTSAFLSLFRFQRVQRSLRPWAKSPSPLLFYHCLQR